MHAGELSLHLREDFLAQPLDRGLIDRGLRHRSAVGRRSARLRDHFIRRARLRDQEGFPGHRAAAANKSPTP